ncbi:hypothetical protein DFJ43DRAFT_1042579 [Lentinula guzmanii]|uniref:Uncharacterized protein n=1 Tax=Lentinula guzmanii TaxID=2804957 RepID=A0AA38MWJ1_9AGAR|nr:hypothetical protein DFJ43DRAFT_1042579 [Lentinula guzmanii]
MGPRRTYDLKAYLRDLIPKAQDELLFARLGYKQEFKRNVGISELSGLAFSIQGVLPGIAETGTDFEILQVGLGVLHPVWWSRQYGVELDYPLFFDKVHTPFNYTLLIHHLKWLPPLHNRLWTALPRWKNPRGDHRSSRTRQDSYLLVVGAVFAMDGSQDPSREKSPETIALRKKSGQSLIEHSYKADSDLSPPGWEYAERFKDFVLERRAKNLAGRGAEMGGKGDSNSSSCFLVDIGRIPVACQQSRFSFGPAFLIATNVRATQLGIPPI